VRARNTAEQSDNKIHDDTVARDYGFRGGLVPGRDVYAYMAHFAVERWGVAWLTSGKMSVSLRRAVYHDDVVEVLADATASDELRIEVHDGSDTLCASAVATNQQAGEAARPSRSALPARTRAGERPAASPESLAVGTMFAAHVERFSAVESVAYLDDIGETAAVFVDEGVAHPGWLLKQANCVLMDNVVLGPWIHVGSNVTHFGLIHDGSWISTRARVTQQFERAGHRFAVLDVMLVNGRSVVARIEHVVIYEPRRAGRGGTS
jgi:hypothetical protein